MSFLLNCLKSYPPQRGFDHATELEHGARPPAQAPYRMAPAELAELRKQLDWLLEARLIQSSKAPYRSPVLFQRKQDGSMKMCLDYRALNKVTIKNKYSIPNVMDLFDKLTKAKFYTKIDLRSRYWQVSVARGDEPKTMCVTRYDSFEVLVMPFSLTNTPATFCNLMNDVLYEVLDRFVVYLDDISAEAGYLFVAGAETSTV
ncbi:UNVERIFIED_CONTAM: RNA-directed DNA polymerase [Sesamum calycinum]|uniref:RNA-directed DNA polymerase n=1 Tax=Sesamum calycinum TaxID=2727403 RepID=A0AAW2J7J0_9LAMI